MNALVVVRRRLAPKLAVASAALLPIVANAQTTFEGEVFTALTTKVNAVATEAAPYIAIVLGIYLVYKMVRRFMG